MTIPIEPAIVSLPRIINIENAVETSAILKKALNEHQELRIDFSSLRELDLPGIQILFSVSKTALEKKKTCAWFGSIQPELCAKLFAAGIIKNVSATGEDLMAAFSELPIAGRLQ